MVHTLILSTPKMVLPKVGQTELVLFLIKENKIDIDYFGIEIDNPVDYMDEEMEIRINSTCFINLFFEDEEIDYKKYSKSDILKLAENLISNSLNSQVISDDKDIDIYIQ